MHRTNKKGRPLAGRTFLLFALSLLAMAVSFCVFAGCEGVVRTATAENVDYAYVGRVIRGEPVHCGDEVRIPLRFEGGAWAENSGRVLRDVQACFSGWEIDFTVYTCLAGRSAEVAGPAITIDGLAPGRYRLFYRDPDGTRHPVGFVDVP